jgi:hypothetical protein
MELKDFAFATVPPIDRPLRFGAEAADTRLGLLEGLKGTWAGKGFNVI